MLTVATMQADAQTPSTDPIDHSWDARARESEQKMTDGERFSLILDLMGAAPSIGAPRDKRIRKNVKTMSAGYSEACRSAASRHSKAAPPAGVSPTRVIGPTTLPPHGREWQP